MLIGLDWTPKYSHLKVNIFNASAVDTQILNLNFVLSVIRLHADLYAIRIIMSKISNWQKKLEK